MLTHLKKPKSRPSSPPLSSVTKYKITITQPANGKIEVKPDLPADGKVDKGSELTFTLSANTGYKVKELTINGITYTDVTDNTITQKVKIEKNTAVSAVVEEEASQPAEQITIVNSVIYVTKDAGGNIIKASGTIFLNEIEELAQKSTNNIVINTDALTIKSFNGTEIIKVAENDLQAVINKLSVLNIENQDFTKQSITLNIENNKLKITSITGNISLKDITENSNQEPTEIAKYIAKKLKENSDTNFDSSNLTINTFYKKTTGRGAPSRDSSQRNPEYTYESTPITPKFLKETKQNALNKAVLNFKDSNEVMHVNFESYQGDTKEQKQNDYFDINEFSNEIEKGKLKNISASDIKGFIFLRGKKEKINGNDNYPEISKLVKISEKLGKKFTVGSVEISGNVGEILQKLINKEILEEEETGKSIKFIYDQNLCTTDFYTGYFGTKSNPNLSAEQIQEYYNRSDIMQLDDVTITGLNSENYKGNFIKNMLTNVNFINCTLSKISFHKSVTGGGYLKFENSTLPTNMSGSTINKIILKNVTFPREEFNSNPEYDFTDLPYNVPHIKDSLEIYGEIKNSILKDATPEQLDSLVPQENMPPKYKGSEEIYNRLKKIFRGEAQNKDFGNYQGSIQKRQSQLLALLQTQNKSRG